MKIKTSELYFGYESHKLAGEQRLSGEISSTSRNRRNETGKDRVSLSFTGRSWSSSRKLSEMFSQSLVRERNGHEYRLSHNTVKASRRDRGRESGWQLGISNIRTSGQNNISTSSRTRYESEQMSFSGTGNITMVDGRRVEFSLEMLMQREFEVQEAEALSASTIRLMDPLVINFSGTTPTLTDRKYQFDLDSDGFYENISFVGPGSGFLTLDLNEDGLVNDGRELFGPNIGNGFNELKVYDKDGNHWIDENDPIYEELKVWSKDGSGQDRLQSLEELGIGAISLENTATPFSITNHQNELQGKVSHSSVIMKEDGSVHTVQQIDLMAAKSMVAVTPTKPVLPQEILISKQNPAFENAVNQLQKNAIKTYSQQEEQLDDFARRLEHSALLRDELIIAQLQSRQIKDD